MVKILILNRMLFNLMQYRNKRRQNVSPKMLKYINTTVVEYMQTRSLGSVVLSESRTIDESETRHESIKISISWLSQQTE